MRAVIQRVAKATLKVNGKAAGTVKPGLVLEVGVARNDNAQDVAQLVHRVVNMRLFNNEEGRMSQSLKDVSGQVILLNQASIMGDTGKGRRPSFTYAAGAAKRESLMEELKAKFEAEEIKVHTAAEDVTVALELEFDGPVTMLADTKNMITFRKRRQHRQRPKKFLRHRRGFRERGYRDRGYRDRGSRGYRDRGYRDRDRGYRDRDRGYDRGYDRDRGRDYDRGHDYDRGRGRDFDRGRDRDYDRDRSYRGRDRYDDRDRGRRL